MANKKIRAVLIGLAHAHAMTLVRDLRSYEDDVDFLGYADIVGFDGQTKEERMWTLGDNTDLKEYADYHELLDLKPDVAIVTVENSKCADICCEVLERGIAVINEKPMSNTYEGAKRMVECAKKNNTYVFTNWPIAWFPPFRLAKKLADEGKVGQVLRVVYRTPATWGPFSYGPDKKNPPPEELLKSWWYHNDMGGGSIMDYACYGAILTSWIIGKRAERVSCITKQFTTASFCDVEDYSYMMADFGDKIGFVEGSWSSFNPGEVPTGPVIYGTEGTIVCDRRTNSVKIYACRDHGNVPPTEVIDTTDMPANSLFGKNIIDYFRGEGEVDVLLSHELNLDACALLDAGVRSAKSGKFEETYKD